MSAYSNERGVYFPYPDPMVDFAFLMVMPGQELKMQLDHLYVTYEEYLNRLQKTMDEKDYQNFVTNEKLNLIIYPVAPMEEQVFRWFALAQALAQLTSATAAKAGGSGDVAKRMPLVPRIHPGSPHMYWRNLWTDADAHYELVDHPLTYHNVKNPILLPLDDSLDTQLVVSASTLSTRQVESKVAQTSIPLSNVYCGDVKVQWENEYKAGRAGNFSRCRELYHQQTDLGRRLFGKDFKFAVQEMSAEMTVAARHEVYNPYISIGEVLLEKLDELEAADEELKKEEEETEKFIRDFSTETTMGVFDDDQKDLELEDAALEWQLKKLTEELKMAKKNYFEKEKELYKIQKLPFIRNK